MCQPGLALGRAVERPQGPRGGTGTALPERFRGRALLPRPPDLALTLVHRPHCLPSACRHPRRSCWGWLPCLPLPAEGTLSVYPSEQAQSSLLPVPK